MSLIREKVTDDFLAWAGTHADKDIFPAISAEENSYYMDRDTDQTYIMEYSFQDMFALREALEEYSDLKSDPCMLKRMTIELFQNRYVSPDDMNRDVGSQSSTGKKQEEQKSLPEFRYEF